MGSTWLWLDQRHHLLMVLRACSELLVFDFLVQAKLQLVWKARKLSRKTSCRDMAFQPLPTRDFRPTKKHETILTLSSTTLLSKPTGWHKEKVSSFLLPKTRPILH